MKLKIMQKSILLCVIYSMATGSPSPKEIVKKAEEKMRGDTAHAIVTMTVEKIKLKRSMQVEYFDHRLENKMFIRMLAPKKDQGITFLKLKENLWQYLPSIGKEIKIEASFMQDAWMGSDFSNDDLVKESSFEEDYEHTFVTAEDEKFYAVQFIPKPSAAVVWSRIIIHYDKESYLSVKEEFYDHKDRLKKLMLLTDIKVMGGRKIPSKMMMASINNNKAVSKTTLEFKSIEFNVRIEPRIFSKANLRLAK